VSSHAPRWQYSNSQMGFVLLEVMVAILLLGILLGALATEAQGALDAAERLWDKAANLSGLADSELDSDAWEWGSRIARVVWEGDRILQVRVGFCPGSEHTVGVWCGGWLLGEWLEPPTEPLKIGPAIWEGHTGEELVVRARSTASGWGPPWRTVVPDAYGVYTLESAGSVQGPMEPQSHESVRTVAHLLCRCTLLPTASWSGSPVTENLWRTTLLLSEYDEGLCRVSLGDREQCWVASKGRRLDVYF
jgi:hypothetical protein